MHEDSIIDKKTLDNIFNDKPAQKKKELFKTILEKKASPIHGQGIFTKNQIPIGETFYEIPMNIIHTEPKSNCTRIASRMFVDDEKVLNWVNHSCAPNSKIEIRNQGTYLMAVRKILAGEEITVDYLVTEERNNLHQCNCKSEKCRNYFATT